MLWKIIWWFLKKIKKRIEGSASKRNLHTHIYSSIIHNSQKVKVTQISTNSWMNNCMWCMYTIEYYSAQKRKEMLTHATMWTDHEDIMLSEKSQSKEKMTILSLLI